MRCRRCASNLANLETHLAATQRIARPFLGLAPLLGWLPEIGPTVRDTPQLLEMGIELAGGGRQALDALMPVVDLLGQRGQGELLARALPLIAAAGPELAAADTRLARAEALADAGARPAASQAGATISALQAVLLPLACTGMKGAQIAPSLLGMDSPRTYLVLAQNNDELRPTGGFISGAGHVRLDNGQITEIKLGDSYAVDNFEQPHPEPPAMLRELMGADLLLLRDSNWSPDFPTSALVARALYAQDRGIDTDGAIALDMEAVRLLVEAVGPLQVPGIEQPITGENTIAALKQAWEAPPTTQDTVQSSTSNWWEKRKDFLGIMVAAVMAKLQGGDLDPAALAKALYEMLDGRHLQIAVDDPDVAALLAERRWDGALQLPREGDFLTVIDTNVGFNKANAVVKPQIDYRVARDGNDLMATLTITYTHTAQPLAPGTLCDRTPRYGDSYDELTVRCFWDYLRVYAPAGSEMVAAEGLERTKTERGEGNTTVFSGEFVLKPGESHKVVLRYRLPNSVATEPYQLFVRKQAGTAAPPLRVQAGACLWQTDLGRDREFECESAR